MTQHILFNHLQKNLDLDLLIVSDAKEANELSSVAKYFGKKHILFPDLRASYGEDLRAYKDEILELFSALRSYHKEKCLVISPLKTLLFHLPKDSSLQSFELGFADTLNLEKLKERLFYWGYSFVDIIEVEGEVSFRGDIIDIFVPSTPNPYRISLFDREVEEIKCFDVSTQKSHHEILESIEIVSTLFSLSKDEYETLSKRVENSDLEVFEADVASLGLWHLGDLGENFLEGRKALFISNLSHIVEEAYAFMSPQVPKSSFDLEVLEESEQIKSITLSDVKTLISLHKDRRITIIAANDAILKSAGIYESSDFRIIKDGYILNILTPDELIISLNSTQKTKRKRKTSILLDALRVGDYVVHEDYGVGVFDGIENSAILGGVKDFIVIRYMGDDRVLLPVENLNYIDRYIAAGGALPALDRLGKGSFAKLKESVRAKLFEIASSIVNTAAARALIEAPILEIKPSELEAFRSLSGFSYTPDQLKATDEIATELASGRIMDRLLSGDVGFGKTEVAMCALYQSVLNGYQGALIVPTTLLSTQHTRTLKQRFDELGIKVAKLDRFVSSKEKKLTLEALKDGSISIVVGTHALFDVEFKKLALVVIDEEHKFGVKQKEHIKELYSKTHMLSMSATPIPRSLNQALSEIKTLSELLTPPNFKQDVRTFVRSYDEKLIKEVIQRELRRGGQIFYVHNSIDHMIIKFGELKALLPELRIVMLHSKVSAIETEKELLKFENGEYDVMLSTSIIESGIHMPRVNSIIVDGAERFGMADLHQLRGRVGRGAHEGFAYFIVEDKEALKDEAKKRLLALESNSYLGSGLALAYHDLEIRGGGNLVGDAQSGHIKNIGYSLYLKMLEDAIKELSNKSEKEVAKVDIKLSVSAFISSEVVAEDRLRLDLYRRLSACKEVSEVYEIQEEVLDRFGELDSATKQFFNIVEIKILSIKLGIKTITNYAQNITISYDNGEKITLKSTSKDDDDIIKEILKYLRSKN